MSQNLPSLRMVIVSSLLSASLTVLGLSLASDRIVALTAAAPLPDPHLPQGVDVPEYVRAYQRPAVTPSGE